VYLQALPGLLVILVPVQPLLVELDHHLRDLQVGLLGGHQVGLVRALPLDEEVELPRVVGGADDLLLRARVLLLVCLDQLLREWWYFGSAGLDLLSKDLFSVSDIFSSAHESPPRSQKWVRQKRLK